MTRRLDPSLALMRTRLVFARSVDESRCQYPFKLEADHARYGAWVARQHIEACYMGRNGWYRLPGIVLGRLSEAIQSWEKE